MTAIDDDYTPGTWRHTDWCPTPTGHPGDCWRENNRALGILPIPEDELPITIVRERAANPLVLHLSEGPGAIRMGEDEWEPADPSLTLEPCEIGPATVAQIDLAATGWPDSETYVALHAATSIELTIEDIDDLIATLLAIKEDAIANRGFAIRDNDYWTNGIEED